jgi:predicted ester cyclase
MAVDMKQLSRRLLEEAFGKGNLEVFDEVCDRGCRSHDPVTGDADLQKAKEVCRGYKTAFPDLACTILGSYADGDTVVTHWRMNGTHQKPLMGVEATGKRCTVEGVAIDRFRGGKIVESWVQWDALGLLRQLGVAPEMTAGGSAPRAGERRPHV